MHLQLLRDFPNLDHFTHLNCEKDIHNFHMSLNANLSLSVK